MPNIVNNFIKAKMNKDLDARLIPNGEYRDAQNLSISRSSGDDVGTFQNILGNIYETDFGLEDKNLEIIGYYVSEVFNCFYFFLTNYNDISANNTNFAVDASSHYIIEYNLETGTRIIAEGTFLNFSKTSPIGGVDMIENLLFFTDNRNQPRKINVQKSNGYYLNEDAVSVLKYYPFQSVEFITEEVNDLLITGAGTGWDALPSLPFIPEPQQIVNLTGTGTGIVFSIDSVSNVTGAVTGVTLIDPGFGYENGDTLTIDIKAGGVQLVLTISASVSSTMKNRSDQFLPPVFESANLNPNPDYDADWPGDPDYLKQRFVRFSYRFIYDEDERSLIAPFSQVAFVPKNDGYFNKKQLDPTTGSLVVDSYSDEQETYESTINGLLVNKIDEVGIVLKCPNEYTSWSQAVTTLKIQKIEILYKEEQEIAIKVVDTIEGEFLSTINGLTYIYKYQSRKPIKVLPEAETVRVADKGPIRAKTLSCAGNRVIYANYLDKHTSPEFLDYNVITTNKPEEFNIEYQNHSLKTNRTYQVGVILSDRYGRKSDVILSSVDDGTIQGLSAIFKGSTIYNSYRNSGSTPLNTNTSSYQGLCPEIVWKNIIPSSIPQEGYPGIYSTTNPLGWYSWQIAIKQQEQEYYNVYLPSILRAYPNDATKEQFSTAHISLNSDNINKVPKMLNNIGPETNQFSSEERMWCIVTNKNDFTAGEVDTGNVQFFPTKTSDITNTIGTVKDLGLGTSKTSTLNGGGPLTANAGPFDKLELASVLGRDEWGIGQRINLTLSSGQEIPGVDGLNRKLLSLNRKLVTGGGLNTVIKFTPDITNAGTGYAADEFQVEFINSPFYNAASNPLIGRLAINRSQDTGSMSEYPGAVVKTAGGGLTTFENYFPLNLAVYETTPVQSNLEIYWGTTTTGTVSELNEEIANGNADVPVDVSFNINNETATFMEDSQLGDFVTNTIYPVSANGNLIINPNAAFSIASQAVMLQNTATDFGDTFITENDGSGGFRIKLNPFPTEPPPGNNQGDNYQRRICVYNQDDDMGYRRFRVNVIVEVNYFQIIVPVEFPLSSNPPFCIWGGGNYFSPGPIMSWEVASQGQQGIYGALYEPYNQTGGNQDNKFYYGSMIKAQGWNVGFAGSTSNGWGGVGNAVPPLNAVIGTNPFSWQGWVESGPQSRYNGIYTEGLRLIKVHEESYTSTNTTIVQTDKWKIARAIINTNWQGSPFDGRDQSVTGLGIIGPFPPQPGFREDTSVTGRLWLVLVDAANQSWSGVEQYGQGATMTGWNVPDKDGNTYGNNVLTIRVVANNRS